MTFLLLLWGATLRAQHYPYRQYTTADGLPTNYVYGVIEDEDGYIWAYTENGLAKFDGYQFQVYTTAQGLPGNDIPQVAKDATGRIWLSVYGNRPACLYRDSVYVAYPEAAILKGRWGRQVFFGKPSGRLLVSPEKGQVLEDQLNTIDTSFVQRFPNYLRPVKSVPLAVADTLQPYPYMVCRDKDSLRLYTASDSLFLTSSLGHYWLQEDHCLFLPYKGQWREIPVNFTLGSPVYTQGAFSYLDDNHLLIRPNGERAYVVDLRDASIATITYADYGIHPLRYPWIMVAEDHCWISTHDGSLQLDLSGKVLNALRIPALTSRYDLLNTYEDSRGNLWIGSRNGGLFFIPAAFARLSDCPLEKPADVPFKGLLRLADDEYLGFTLNAGVYYITDTLVRQLQAPSQGRLFRDAVLLQDKVWWSTDLGLYYASYRRGAWRSQDARRAFPIPRAVSTAGRDNLEINTSDQRFPAGSVLPNSYLAVREDPLRIHALTKHALYTLSADSSQQFSQLTTSVGLFGLQAQAIVPAHADVYVGHWAGLGTMGAQGYRPFLADRPQLRSITTLYGAPDQLWIGTEDRGLFCYQFSEDSLYAVSTVNYVRRIRPDTDSTLLVASNKGVLLVDSRQLQSLDQISVADGLPTEVIEDVCRYRDGRILVATSAGLHLAERSSRRPTHLAADALRFTSTHVNERPVDLSTTAAFAYRQNNFALHFYLQSYASQGNITYTTRLEPLEKAWRVQSARYREFPALPPGNYRFHLKASDVYGNELSLPPLEWRIYPPFWQRWWFWGLVGLLVLGLLLWWLRRRDQRVREEQLLSKRMASLQLAALKAQMNPHFVFNALGAIQYYIQTNDAEAADRYLTMFAGLMRRYLNSSREQIISLDEEIALLDTYTRLEMMRFEQQFTTTIRVDKALSRQDHYLPSMLLQPFVENAINHGLCERPDAAGELLIYFSGEGDTLRCVIADNGIGLEKARQRPSRGHRSSGMRIIDEKVQTLAASGQAVVTIERTEHQPEHREFPGTRITITIKNLEYDDH